jgi:hypothetical protein
MSHHQGRVRHEPVTAARSRVGPLGRLARTAFRRRGRVVLAWVGTLIVAFSLSTSFSGDFSADYSAPGSDSSTAQELLEQHFTGKDSVAVTFVVQAPGTVDSPTARAQIASLRARIAGVPHVSHVGDPYAGTGVRSANGTALRFDAIVDVDAAEKMPKQDAQALIDAADAATAQGLEVAVGGDVILLTQAGEIGSEGIGLAAAAVILLLTFGSVIAAGLPILIAIVGLAASVLLTTLVAAALPVPDWSTSLVAMMVLGVGIDYTLLLVTRFREWRAHGLSVEDATVATPRHRRPVRAARGQHRDHLDGRACRDRAVVHARRRRRHHRRSRRRTDRDDDPVPRAAGVLRLAHRPLAPAAAASASRGVGRRLVALEPAHPALSAISRSRWAWSSWQRSPRRSSASSSELRTPETTPAARPLAPHTI